VPFVRPTLAELATRTVADFRGRLGTVGALLRRAVADIAGIVWAGAVHEVHGHLEWLSLQLFASSAERQYLLIIADMYGIRPTPATFATGPVICTGDDGEIVPEDTILVRSDGFTYRVTADSDPIAGGTVTVIVEAVLAGSDGNLDEGESLVFESPIPNIDSTATVGDDGIVGGFEEEDTEGTRDRLLLRLREPPEGGADQDYEAWAIAVAGVTRAWVYPNENGLGTVVVRFVMDEEDDIFPNPTAVAAVQAALDEERPITAEVTALAPTPLEVDFTIAVVPNTVAVQDAVEAELADLLLRLAEPGDGETDRGTILLSKIQTAIGVAQGIEDFTLTVPAADVVPALGELAVMGTITWA